MSSPTQNGNAPAAAPEQVSADAPSQPRPGQELQAPVSAPGATSLSGQNGSLNQPQTTNGSSDAPPPPQHSSAPLEPPQNPDGVDVPSPAAQQQAISADEIALYDRQIRLWGMKAQEQIRNANILIVNIRALGSEIAKNLVLAGVGSLTISDQAPVSEEDLGAQFFVSQEDVGKPRAEAALPRIQKLNQRVKVSVLQENPLNAADATLFMPFTVVIGTDMPVVPLTALSTACRFAQKPFYAGGSHGIYGYIFADLISHTFAITRDAPNVATQAGTRETPTRTITGSTLTETGGKKTELVTKHEEYQPFMLINTAPLPEAIMRSARRKRQVLPLLPILRALWTFETNHGGMPPVLNNSSQLAQFTALVGEKVRELQLPLDQVNAEAMRSFLQNVYLELAPTAAFLGASLAQDVINVLSQREQPIQNLMLFDGEEGRSEIYALQPFVTTQDAGGL